MIHAPLYVQNNNYLYDNIYIYNIFIKKEKLESIKDLSERAKSIRKKNLLLREISY